MRSVWIHEKNILSFLRACPARKLCLNVRMKLGDFTTKTKRRTDEEKEKDNGKTAEKKKQ